MGKRNGKSTRQPRGNRIHAMASQVVEALERRLLLDGTSLATIPNYLDVALGAPAKVTAGTISGGDLSTLTNGTLAPRGTYWQDDSVYWYGASTVIEVDLPHATEIDAVSVQADNNDAYQLDYQDPTTGNWNSLYSVEQHDISSGGLVSRPDYPDVDSSSSFPLPSPVTTAAVRIYAVSGDDEYAVSQIRLLQTDGTVPVRPLTLNQTATSKLDDAFGTDEWSFTGTAGQQVQFQLLAQTGSPAFTLVAPDGTDLFSNISASSNLTDLPTTGTYSLVVHGTGVAASAYSFVVQQTTVNSLTLGTPVSGTFAGDDDVHLFEMSVPTAGPLSLAVTGAPTTDHTELFAQFGTPPTLDSAQYSDTSTGADPTLLIPNATTGNWYVLVYGESDTAGDGFTLSATASEVILSGVAPDQGAATAPTTLTISGAGFGAGTTVGLTTAAGIMFGATSTTVDLPTQITAAFAAGSVPAGSYSVNVTQPDGTSATLPDAFTMAATGQAILSTHLEIPDPMTRHIAETLFIDYSNTGNVAMPAPLLILSATNPLGQSGALFTLDPTLQGEGLWTNNTPVGYSQSVEVLASGATPGVLQPGESERIPVYYAGWLTSQWDFDQPTLNFSLQVIKADDATAVDWSSMSASLQPSGVTTAAWTSIFSNLQTQLGTTAGGYVTMLDNQANYLGQLGEDVTDVQSLWGAAVQQADNALNPLSPYLASATDDSVATPGSLSLDFSRVFAESISGRDTMGPLGMGWSTPWQTSAIINADSSITITGPAGAQRIFEPDNRSTGAYISQPGDTGTLASDGNGGYLLTESDGTETDFTSAGLLNYMQDTDGNRITAGFTGSQLTSLNASSGQYINLSYNSAGLISSITDSDGRTTNYGYDSTNTYLTSVSGFNGQTTTYTYNAQNALTTIAFPGGTHQYFTYDSENRLAGTSSDGGAQPQTFAYNLGETSVTDGTGDTSSTYYNENGLVARSVDALGNPTYYTYNSQFNLASVTNALGQSETYTYNNAGEVVTSTDFLGNKTNFTYSGSFNQLSTLTDANGNQTAYSYDTSGNLLSTTYADGTTSSSTYDPEGNALSFLNQNGQPINYTYNANGQVLTESFSDGTSYAYTYDNNGNLLTATDSTGITTFTYDPTTELMTEVAYPGGLYLKFSYNSAGQRTQMVDQTGFTTNYQYDTNGRLSGLTDGSGNAVVTYTYDADGRLATKTNGNGTYTTYTYDADGNVLSLYNYAPGGAVNSSFVYTYNTLGLETTETTIDGEWTYGYDADGQLTTAVFAPNSTDPDGLTAQNELYNYDAMGNRTSTVINGVTTTYVVNDMNEYTSVGGIAYSYNANGDLSSDGTNSYNYDSINQMTSEVINGSTTTFVYNALGENTSTIASGSETQNLIDPGKISAIVGQFNSSGGTLADFTYGQSLASESASGRNFAFDFDAAGSVVGVTDATGTYANSFGYSPFGNSVSSTGASTSQFQFGGELGVVQESANTVLMRSRVYLVAIGRFAQPDPIGIFSGDNNRYRYVGNNPIAFNDPNGTNPLALVGGLIGTGLNVGVYGVTHWGSWTAGGFAGAAISGAIQGAYIGGTGGIGLFADAGVAAVAGDIGYGVEKAIDGGFTWEGLAAQTGLGFGAGFIPTPFKIEELQPSVWGLGAPEFKNLILGANKHGFYLWAQALDGKIKDNIAELAKSILELILKTVNAMDPNALYGPAGYGPSNFVAATGDSTFPYRIDFENASTATAPAQSVTVSDQLDPNLDWSSFQLNGIGWGNFYLTAPAGSQSYQTTQSMTYNGSTFNVLVTAGIHTGTGQVYATFQSIDPTTGLPPASALIGFLPPEDGTGRGDGYVSFSIKPKANLATGTAIRNIANITFDDGVTIATNLVNDDDPTQGTDPTKEALVTIDGVAPTSTVAALAANATPTFNVRWSGSDDAGGSGIASYDIYVSVDGGAFTPWQTATTATSATYTGARGHTYAFFSIARDNAGNVQTAPTSAQASTAVLQATRFISFSQKTKAQFTDAAGKVVTVSLSGPGTGQLGFVDNSNSDPLTFTLTGTTAKSTVTVTATRGVVTLGDVETTGSLAGFKGANTDLDGLFEVTGTLGSLLLKDVENGPETIDVQGSAVATSYRFGMVKGLALTSASPIVSLAATSWTHSDPTADTLTAPSLATLKITGGLDASVNLTAGGLTTASIGGAISAGSWTATGGAKSIAAGSISAGWAASFGGDVGTVSVKQSDDGSITAQTIKSMTVGGSLTDGKVDLTGTSLGKTASLGLLNVRGDVLDSQITAVGNIGAVSAGGITGSDLFAGVAAGTTMLPTTAGDFAESSSILSFTTKGTATFADSLIAAATIGTVSLKNVTTDNGGTVFGVAAESLKSFALAQAKAKPLHWSSKQAVSLLQSLPGDLRVNID